MCVCESECVLRLRSTTTTTTTNNNNNNNNNNGDLYSALTKISSTRFTIAKYE